MTGRTEKSQANVDAVLKTLRRYSGGVSVHRLAYETGLTRGQVRYALDGLLAADLVIRSRSFFERQYLWESR